MSNKTNQPGVIRSNQDEEIETAPEDEEEDDSESASRPRVIFFPEQGGPDTVHECQDARETSAGKEGFNTFAFLSFLISTYNAIR